MLLVEKGENSFTQVAYELRRDIYKEIFLDRQRDYYFPILVEKQHKNKQSLKQNKTVETYPECDGH